MTPNPMSEMDHEPTNANEALQAALHRRAYSHIQRSSANTCYAASERIYELTQALRDLSAAFVNPGEAANLKTAKFRL